MRIRKTISEDLIQAITLREFRTSSGKRRRNMPYWIRHEDPQSGKVTWIFNFINEDSNVYELQEQIKSGSVYIRTVDAIDTVPEEQVPAEDKLINHLKNVP